MLPLHADRHTQALLSRLGALFTIVGPPESATAERSPNAVAGHPSTLDEPHGKFGAVALTPRRLGSAVAVIFAVAALFFFPLFLGDTFVDVASRQNELYPWAMTHIDRPPTLHYDQPDQYYPWQVFLNRALRSGELPLWNPYSFAGTPYVSNGQNGIFYPPRFLLSLTVPPERVHDGLVVSHMLLGGLTMYLLLAFVRLSFPAALFGAVAWMINSFMLAWMGLTHYVVVEAWLPLAVLFLYRLVTQRSWLDGVWLGIVLALLYFGGHIMYVLISVMACAALGGFLLLRSAWRQLSHHASVQMRDLVRSSLLVALPFGIMAGLCAVQLLPTLDLGQEAARVALPFDLFVSRDYRIEPGQLLYFFLPPPAGVAPGRVHIDAGWLFLGTPTAVFALLGLKRRHPLAIFARWLALIVLLIALGTLASWLAYYLVPGFKFFKPISRVLFLFQFAISILAAFGLDFLLRQAPRTLHWGWWARWPGWLRAAIPYVALVVVVGQMYQLGTVLIRHQPAGTRDLFPETPLTRMLGRGDGTRILPVIPGKEVQPDHPVGRFFYGATAMVFPIESALGYDNPPDRIANLWRVVEGNAPERVLGPPRAADLLRPPDDREQRIWAFVPVFRVNDVRFDLLPRVGVTDIVAPPYVERDLAWDVQRFEPTQLELRYSGLDGQIYHVGDAFPRAYLVPGCEVAETPQAALERFTEPAHDARQSVLVERGAIPDIPSTCQSVPSEPSPGNIGSADILARSVNRLTIRVSAARPGWLVVNESWDSGWQATVDGTPVAVYPGNYSFRTLPVPAGEHTVELTYLPQSLKRGALVSVATLLGVLGLVVTPAVRRQRASKRLALLAQHADVATAAPDGTSAGRWARSDAHRALSAFREGIVSHRLLVGYGLVVAAVALFHQWVGVHTMLPYFTGDGAKYLDAADSLATNLRPDLGAILRTASPVSVAAYMLVLRSLNGALIRDGGAILTATPIVGAGLAALGTMLVLTVALLARRIIASWRAAVVATILAGMYVPFVTVSERALDEIPLALLIVLTIICVYEAVRRRSLGFGVGAGVLFALAVATHSEWLTGLVATMFVALAVGTMVACRRRDGRLVRALAAVGLTGLGLLAIRAGVVATIFAGQPVTNASQALSQNSIFSYATTDGWVPDGSYRSLAPEGSAPPERAATQLALGQQPACSGSLQLLPAPACVAIQSPLWAAQTIAINQVRLWWNPYDALHVDLGAVSWLLPFYHRLLLLAGLSGCALLMVRRRLAGVMLSLPILFLAAWFTLRPAEIRYTVVAFPSLIAGASFLLLTAERAARLRAGRDRIRLVLTTAGAAIACSLVLLTLGGRSAHAPWSVALTSPQQLLIQHILLAAPPQPDERFAVVLDLQPLDGDLSDLTITLNGHVIRPADSDGGLVFLTTTQEPRDEYQWRYDASRGHRYAMSSPQWVAAPVPAEWVKSGENQVTVALRDGPGSSHGIKVFGELAAPGERELNLPALFETSAMRYDNDGEARIQDRVALGSMSRLAYRGLYSGGATSEPAANLVPVEGTYHLFLGVLSPEPPPTPIAAMKPSTADSVAARLDPLAPDTPIDSFWLLASTVGRVRVTIFADQTALASFVGGDQAHQRWTSNEVQASFEPYNVGDPPLPEFPYYLGAERPVTPVQGALLRWYSTRPAAGAPPSVDELPKATEGVYVVKLREPVSAATLAVAATPLDEADEVSWSTILPPATGDAAARGREPVVLARSPDHENQYIGNRKALAPESLVPHLFIVHGSDFTPGTTLRRASAQLDLEVPAARLEPIAAPLSFPRVTANGQSLTSYWTAMDGPGMIALPPVQVRLE